MIKRKEKMNHTTVINKISELGYKGFKDAYIGELGHLNRKHLDSLFKNIF